MHLAHPCVGCRPPILIDDTVPNPNFSVAIYDIFYHLFNEVHNIKGDRYTNIYRCYLNLRPIMMKGY